jgi:glycosyltransferase involved in cell wall biosynthesis
MKVTALIMTHNQAGFIDTAIHSAIDQNFAGDYEILVAEDCSSDGTAEIAARACSAAPELTRLVRRHRNLGAQANFHQAIEESRGEYIALLEGDDYWIDPGKIRKQVAFLDQHPECTLVGHAVWFEQAGERLPDPGGAQPVRQGLADLLVTNRIQSSSIMFRRRDALGLPAWLATYCGDWAFFIHLARLGWVGFLPEHMGVYRYNPHGMWQSLSAVERSERVVEFRETLSMVLDEPFASQMPALIWKGNFQGALTAASAGETEAARRFLARLQEAGAAPSGIGRSARMAVALMRIMPWTGRLIRPIYFTAHRLIRGMPRTAGS